MATSKIILYSTQIDPARNMVVEEIDAYLATCPSTQSYEIMYVKPGMEAKVNISWPQVMSWIPGNSTYAKVTTDNKTYYYFVTETEWKAQNTVGLTLSLDTVNTYWNDYRNKFTDRTHITRQHKDRFLSNGARVVDEFDEGITPILRYVGSNKLGGTDPLWYLIYRSDTTDADSTVSCYACSSQRYRVTDSQSAGTTRWNRDQFTSGYFYYIIAEDDIGDPEIGVEYGISGYVHVAASSAKPVIKIYLDGNGYVRVKRYSRSGVADTGYPYEQALEWVDFIKSRRMYYGAIDSVQLSDIEGLPSMSLQAGNIGALYVEKIDSIDRTDNQIIKILELGYAPFTVTVSSGDLQIPTGWTYDYNRAVLKLDSLNTEFENPSIATYSLANIAYASPLNVNVNGAPDALWESKLYNSNFFSLKFGYDAETWTFKPERLAPIGTATYSTYPYLTIGYKPSNGINTSCGFKFNYIAGNNLSYYLDELDYPNILVSTRNNELPLYNNEYLNYLKYGKQYADRQTATNIGATWLSTLLSIGGGVAAGAIVGSAPGAIIGGIVGAISGTANAITSTVKAIDSQQQKEWELQHQVTNITGNSDLDIFKWYSGGKLWYFKREPTPRMKELLFKLFFRGGYTCNEYGIPKLGSRYWFNFLQCTPSFEPVDIYQPFIDDIKKRYEAGVTIFHYRNGAWNLEYTKENWESKLVGIYDIDDLSFKLPVILDLEGSLSVTLAGRWDGPTLNGTTQYVKLDIFSTEQAWTDNVPTSTINVIPNVYGAFTDTFTTNAGMYCARAQVVDTNTPLHNSGTLTLPHERFVPVDTTPIELHSCAIENYEVVLSLNMNGVYLDGYEAYLEVEFLNQTQEVYLTYSATNAAIGPEIYSHTYNTPSIPDYVRVTIKSQSQATWSTDSKVIYVGGYSYNG